MAETVLNLTVPAGLAATLVMRPSIPRSGPPVTSLTGADIALWLAIMDIHAVTESAESMRIEQRQVTVRFGRITRDRMLDSMRRLSGSELYLEDFDRWVPALVAGYEYPMPRTDPRVPVAPEWGFDIDADLIRSWSEGVDEEPVHVHCGRLRELTSRYAVAVWLRFLVWPQRIGVVPPDHWNLVMPDRGTGMRLDVPADEIGDFFGFDGSLPPTKVAALFITGSGNHHGVVERELVRVMVDYECVPIMSTWKAKPVAYRVRMGGRYLPLGSMTDSKWQVRGPVSRPKRRVRKPAK